MDTIPATAEDYRIERHADESGRWVNLLIYAPVGEPDEDAKPAASLLLSDTEAADLARALLGSSPSGVVCPACNAHPGRPCSTPTPRGRRDVTWFHESRRDLAEGWT